VSAILPSPPSPPSLSRRQTRAQWYSSYPQRDAVPYGAQQPYAVEVSPGRYVIHHPTAVRRLDVRVGGKSPRARR
jgi:hypothetical protein